MKKLVAVFVVGLGIMLTGIAYAGTTLQLDFSNSSIDVINSQTIKVNHVSNAVLNGVPVPGQWWIEFVWDPQQLKFVPEEAGKEVTGNCTGNFTYMDSVIDMTLMPTQDSDSGTENLSLSMTLASVASDYTSATVCAIGLTVVQGDNFFVISNVPGPDHVALFTGNNGWSGCGEASAGATLSGVVTEIPAWFDFNASYTVEDSLANNVISCNQ